MTIILFILAIVIFVLALPMIFILVVLGWANVSERIQDWLER